MPLIAKWRGDPAITRYNQARMIFDLANLSRDDVFYDLGCGHGRVCIWAADRCKLAKGIEEHPTIVKEARKMVKDSRVSNVTIIRGDITKKRIRDANVLFCVIDVSLKDFQRWNRTTRNKNLRIVTLGPPPIPIKPIATRGAFCLTRFPYELARTRKEWYYSVLGSEGNGKDVDRKFGPCLDRKYLCALRRLLKRKLCPIKCKACDEEIKRSLIIYKNQDFILNHSMKPATLGHLILMPRRRVKAIRGMYHPIIINDLTPSEFTQLCKMIERTIHAMKSVLPFIRGERIEQIYVATFNESKDWHLHFHLVPRYESEKIWGPRLIHKVRQVPSGAIGNVVSLLKSELK
jgi:diadenosine tetraphosphate (Ap4A) HIT family hydrolase